MYNLGYLFKMNISELHSIHNDLGSLGISSRNHFTSSSSDGYDSTVYKICASLDNFEFQKLTFTYNKKY